MKIFSSLKTSLKNYFSIGKELIEFFWNQKLWWMIPFILIILLLAMLLIFAQASPLSPFIYTIF